MRRKVSARFIQKLLMMFKMQIFIKNNFQVIKLQKTLNFTKNQIKL